MKFDKIYLSLALLIFFTCISWITSCTHDADITGMADMCFEKDVKPIFASSCAIPDCHDGTGESKLILRFYPQIRQAIVPGKPYSGEIYNSIIATVGENKMPPDGPLSIESRTIIRLWIEQGADSIPCPVTKGINGNGP